MGALIRAAQIVGIETDFVQIIIKLRENAEQWMSLIKHIYVK